MPRRNPAAKPSAARYQPGASSLRVIVIGRSPESPEASDGTGSLRCFPLGSLLLVLDPGVELARRDDPHVLTHRGVADAAELGADHLVAADPVGRQAYVRGQARNGVGLEPK